MWAPVVAVSMPLARPVEVLILPIQILFATGPRTRQKKSSRSLGYRQLWPRDAKLFECRSVSEIAGSVKVSERHSARLC